MSKVGRNDPCPCGSGKKYKKCCEKKGARTFSASVGTDPLAGRVGQLQSGGFFQHKIAATIEENQGSNEKKDVKKPKAKDHKKA